jgi:hypothetical protein
VKAWADGKAVVEFPSVVKFWGRKEVSIFVTQRWGQQELVCGENGGVVWVWLKG